MQDANEPFAMRQLKVANRRHGSDRATGPCGRHGRTCFDCGRRRGVARPSTVGHIIPATGVPALEAPTVAGAASRGAGAEPEWHCQRWLGRLLGRQVLYRDLLPVLCCPRASRRATVMVATWTAAVCADRACQPMRLGRLNSEIGFEFLRGRKFERSDRPTPRRECRYSRPSRRRQRP
jgi:hypothetical protein